MLRITLVSILAACGEPRGDGTSSIPPAEPTSTSTPAPEPDADRDGAPDAVDCAPSDPSVYPGAPDRCGDDAVTDCDRTTDDGLVTVDGTASFTDLQQALDASSAGAEVRVCPGTWIGPFVAERAVDLVAHLGAELTVLDGKGDGRTLSLAAGSTVTGFTVTGGFTAGAGGGLFQRDPGSLTVTDSIVRGNHASDGGGVAIGVDSVAVLLGTTVAANQADRTGGGLSVGAGSTVDLTTSVVEDNSASSGGGVGLDDATLVGGTIQRNQATATFPLAGPPEGGFGGGVAGVGVAAITGSELAENRAYIGGGFGATAGSMVLTDVVIRDNQCSAPPGQGGSGGGGFAYDAVVELLGTTEVTGNTADVGGGVYVQGSTLVGGRIAGNVAGSGGGVTLNWGELVEAVVEGNTATRDGGGVVVYGVGTVRGGALIGNHAGSDGGGIAVAANDTATIEAVAIADNTAGARGGGIHLLTWSSSSVVAEVSDSTLLRNEAPEGGGAYLGTGASALLTSFASDWGIDADDNVPDDVYAGSTVVGYGADATFACDDLGGCAPLP